MKNESNLTMRLKNNGEVIHLPSLNDIIDRISEAQKRHFNASYKL